MLSPQPLPPAVHVPTASSSSSPMTTVAATSVVHQTPMPAPSFSTSASTAVGAISTPSQVAPSSYKSPTSSLPVHAKSVDEAILEASKETAMVMKLDAKRQGKVNDVFKGCNPVYKNNEFGYLWWGDVSNWYSVGKLFPFLKNQISKIAADFI